MGDWFIRELARNEKFQVAIADQGLFRGALYYNLTTKKSHPMQTCLWYHAVVLNANALDDATKHPE